MIAIVSFHFCTKLEGKMSLRYYGGQLVLMHTCNQVAA